MRWISTMEGTAIEATIKKGIPIKEALTLDRTDDYLHDKIRESIKK